MPYELELRRQMARYLAGLLSLTELNRRAATFRWDSEHDSTGGGSDLLNALDLLLAEYSNGDISEDELRESLKPMAVEVSVTVGSTAAQYGQDSAVSEYGFAPESPVQPLVTTR